MRSLAILLIFIASLSWAQPSQNIKIYFTADWGSIADNPKSEDHYLGVYESPSGAFKAKNFHYDNLSRLPGGHEILPVIITIKK